MPDTPFQWEAQRYGKPTDWLPVSVIAQQAAKTTQHPLQILQHAAKRI